MVNDPNNKNENNNAKKDIPSEHYTIKFDKAGGMLPGLTDDVLKVTRDTGIFLETPNVLWTSGAKGISGTSGTSGTSGAIGMVNFIGKQHSFDNSFGDQETIQKTRELEKTIETLRHEVSSLAKEANQAKANEKEKAKVIEQFLAKIDQLSKKENLSFLLRGVNEKAQKLLLESDTFQKLFLETPQCNAFVMSVDIRRSTELMSKARSPQQFADFMTGLCKQLESVIKENYGVFDKFTGDGVLAFFPDFYSGEDAGFYVVSVADQCHKIFEEKYREFRSSFISVLTNVGLGIGIDYGTAHLVKMAGGLTVVGAPVVYACRMSGAPAGTTLLNQPGYEKISEKFSSYCFFRETEIEIKSEGKTLAYQIQMNGKEYFPSLPNWSIKGLKISAEEAQINKTDS